MSGKMTRSEARTLRDKACNALDKVLEVMELPFAVPMTNETVLSLATDKGLFDCVAAAKKVFRFWGQHEVCISVNVEDNTTRMYALKVPTVSEWPTVQRGTRYFHCTVDSRTEVGAQVLAYCRDYEETQRQVEDAKKYIEHVTKECTTFGQVNRMLPAMKHFMYDVDRNALNNIQRISRLPRAGGYDGIRARAAAELLAKATLIQSSGLLQGLERRDHIEVIRTSV